MADQKPRGIDEQCLRVAFTKIGVPWGESIKDSPEIIDTAGAILEWRDRMVAEHHHIAATRREKARIFKMNREGAFCLGQFLLL